MAAPVLADSLSDHCKRVTSLRYPFKSGSELLTSAMEGGGTFSATPPSAGAQSWGFLAVQVTPRLFKISRLGYSLLRCC